MVAHAVRRGLMTTVGAVLVAALALPRPGLAQRTPPEHAQPLLESIREIRSQSDPYAAELIDPLTALGLLHQESGNHGRAAAATEQAVRITRVNRGLHSLDQAPLLRQWIRNEEAIGNHAAAWDLEQELIALLGRHPDDLSTVPILREIGDKRLDLLARYLAGERPPQIVLGCYYDPVKQDHVEKCKSGSRSVAAGSILTEARRSYAAAIDVLLRHDEYASDELEALEMDLLGITYRYGKLMRTSAYEAGKRSLRRLLSYDVARSRQWPARTERLVEIADWDLLFSNNGTALGVYEQAYDALENARVKRSEIDRIFAPETPVMLPSFLPNPLASQEAGASGHIDVAFDITRFGVSRRIEVLDTTVGTTDADTQSLVHLISRSRFRPRLADGEFASRSRVVVRYYVGGRQEPPD